MSTQKESKFEPSPHISVPTAASEAQLPRGHVSTGDTRQGVERDGGAGSPGLVLGPSVTRLTLRVQVGSSPRSRSTARGLRPRSAEAIAALGLSRQEESEAGHLGRALRGTLWGALGCGPFKRRLAQPLGLLSGHLAGSSVHLKPNTDALWSCEILGH